MILGIFLIEKEAAASKTGSNSFPRSVISYSTLIGYSDTILLLTIPNFCSSRSRSVRTFGVMPSIFSRKRLNCVVPLNISLMIRTVHFFPMILKVVSIGHDLSSGLLKTISIIEHFLSAISLSPSTLYLVTKYRFGYVRLINYAYNTRYTNESSWQLFKTNTIQQDNLSSNSCPHMEDRRNIFPMGHDSRAPRSSFCDTRRSWRYSYRSYGYPIRYFLMERV